MLQEIECLGVVGMQAERSQKWAKMRNWKAQRTRKTFSLQLSFFFSIWMLPFAFSMNNYFCFCRLHGNCSNTTLYFPRISVFMFNHTNRNSFFLISVLLRYNWLLLITHRSVGPGLSSYVGLDEISTEFTKTSLFLVWIDLSVLSLATLKHSTQGPW